MSSELKLRERFGNSTDNAGEGEGLAEEGLVADNSDVVLPARVRA